MESLNFINKQMELLSIPYQFGEWSSDNVPDTYFVGEIMDEPTTTEDGAEASTIMLTGFNRGGQYLTLETIKKQIKRHFNNITGLYAKTESGSINVAYENSFYIPPGEADIKKIQINLKIKEWKGAV